MELHTVQLQIHGPVAEHDKVCAVYWNHESAVYNLNEGVFYPSWRAQSEGWTLVKADTWWRRFLVRLAQRRGL